MAKNNSNFYVKSTLSSIYNLIDEFTNNALKMQKSILSLEWQNVYNLSIEQNELNSILDSILTKINNNHESTENEIINLKTDLKSKMNEFKEIQKINSKLLKDNLTSAKMKVKTIFKNKNNLNNNYSEKLKSDSNLWNENAMILNRLA
jgi:hypothetical protein